MMNTNEFLPPGMEYLADDGNALLPVPDWMRNHPHYVSQNMRRLETPAYLNSGVHTGQVNIPGLRKQSRIISMKVPPLYHPEEDAHTMYTILDWIKDIKDW